MTRLSKIDTKILLLLKKHPCIEEPNFPIPYLEHLNSLIERNLAQKITLVPPGSEGRENGLSGFRITPEGRNALEFSRKEKCNKRLKITVVTISTLLVVLDRYYNLLTYGEGAQSSNFVMTIINCLVDLFQLVTHCF